MALQIPSHQVSNASKVDVAASVKLDARQDASHAGLFKVKGTLSFDPASDEYPTGKLQIAVDLSDAVQGVFTVKTVEQLATTGKHSPTVFASGRCVFGRGRSQVHGARYWLAITHNKTGQGQRSPDVIGFVIYDRSGKRVAQATGAVTDGTVSVDASGD